MTKKAEILEVLEKEMLKIREEGCKLISQKENKDKEVELKNVFKATKLSGEAEGLLFAYQTIILLTSEEK